MRFPIGIRLFLSMLVFLVLLSLLIFSQLKEPGSDEEQRGIRSVLERFDASIYNSLAASAAKLQEPSSNIVVIAIDEASIANLKSESTNNVEFSRFPWPRVAHAMLAHHCRQAKAIGYDIYFLEPDEVRYPIADGEYASGTEFDRIFCATLANLDCGTVLVMPDTTDDLMKPETVSDRFCFELDLPEADVLDNIRVPFQCLRESASNLGVAVASAPYGVLSSYRSCWMLPDDSGRLIPSFALALILAAQGLEAKDLLLDDKGDIVAGAYSFPVNLDGTFSFCEYAKPHTHVSAYDVFTSLKLDSMGIAPEPGTPYYYPPSFFKDKIVLIGAVGEGMGDVIPTPNNPHKNGVDVHASAVNNMLTGVTIRKAHPVWNYGLMLLLSLVPAMAWFTRPRNLALATVLTGGIYCLVGAFLARHFHVVIPILWPILTLVVAYSVFGTLYWYLERSRRHELQILEDSKQKFTDMLVHDLKNNMASIMLSLDLVREEAGEALMSHEEFVNVVDDTSIKLLAKINNLLDIRSIQEGKLPLHVEDHKVAGFVDQLAFEYSTFVQNSGFSFELENHLSRTFEARFDSSILSRVMENLLLNSVKYGAVKDPIQLDAFHGPDPETFSICMTNGGPALSEDLKARLFDAFVSGTSNKTHVIKSTGLGLAFCKMAMSAHKGEIEIISPLPNQAGGVKVSLKLPAGAWDA